MQQKQNEQCCSYRIQEGSLDFAILVAIHVKYSTITPQSSLINNPIMLSVYFNNHNALYKIYKTIKAKQQQKRKKHSLTECYTSI